MPDHLGGGKRTDDGRGPGGGAAAPRESSPRTRRPSPTPDSDSAGASVVSRSTAMSVSAPQTPVGEETGGGRARAPESAERWSRRSVAARIAPWSCLVVFVATVLQLGAAAVLPGLPQFAGKAFGARAVLYPVLMLSVPAWWFLRRRRPAPPATPRDVPWGAFTLAMLPFLVDVTGNTLDLYDRVGWFDDVCHLANWALMCGGLGLLTDPEGRASRGLRALAIAGLGALLAIVWELGEWWTFMRFGTELDGAYLDTLGDLALGSLGGLLAAVLVVMFPPRHVPREAEDPARRPSRPRGR